MAVITLGVDVGTTSTKCLAVREDGQIVASAQRAYTLTHGPDGRAEQDAHDFQQAVAATISECVAGVVSAGETRGSVRALAMSTQGDTLIPCDASGAPVAPAMSWMDTRSAAQHRSLLDERGAAFWFRETGQTLGPYSSACKLRWLAENAPDVWARIQRVCYVPDFLAAWLTGRFVTDMPSASWSPFLNPGTRAWSPDAMAAVGVARELLPEAVESGTPIGEVLPAIADELGLSQGVTLVAGAFDQAAAATGAGAALEGVGVLSCGTAWVLYAVAASAAADTAGLIPACCHTRADQWGLVLPFPGGGVYDWYCRELGAREGDYPVSGEPPVFVPHLYGGLAPDFRAESRGSLVGLTMAHTAEDVRLAVMRGIACEARRNVEAAEGIAGAMPGLRMVGGAGRSDVWPQMLADLLARPVTVAGCVEAACLCAASLAAGDPALPQRANGGDREYVPSTDGVAREQALYERYLTCYEKLLRLYT